MARKPSSQDLSGTTLDPTQKEAIERARQLRAGASRHADEDQSGGADETDPLDDGFTEDHQTRGRVVARGSREQDSRHVDEPGRDESDVGDDWIDPSSLDAPEPRPGMCQRWIRASSFGQDDARNYSRKMREGWKPRPADTVPSEFSIPVIEKGKLAGAVVVEGMVLCEMPIELAKKRSKAIQNRTERLTEGIDNDLMRVQRPGRPIVRAHQTTVINSRVAARRAAGG